MYISVIGMARNPIAIKGNYLQMSSQVKFTKAALEEPHNLLKVNKQKTDQHPFPMIPKGIHTEKLGCEDIRTPKR